MGPSRRRSRCDRALGPGANGVRLTEGSQFDPEQTTAALVVPHPDAKYYALARSGGGDES